VCPGIELRGLLDIADYAIPEYSKDSPLSE
jgi:hypothetical protein